MWRITIISNALMMTAFWLLSVLGISKAYNRFVQYPEGGGPVELPLLTEYAASLQFWLGALPLCWILLSALIWRRIVKDKLELQGETLLAFTASTLAIGLVMLLFFTLAGILPFQLIGGLPTQ